MPTGILVGCECSATPDILESLHSSVARHCGSVMTTGILVGCEPPLYNAGAVAATKASMHLLMWALVGGFSGSISGAMQRKVHLNTASLSAGPDQFPFANISRCVEDGPPNKAERNGTYAMASK